MLETYFKQIINDSDLDIDLVFEDFDEPFNSYTLENRIVIKKSLINNVDYSDDINKKNNFYFLLKNLYHEIEHIRQKNDILSDSKIFYEITNYVNQYVDDKYYSNNYDREFIEIFANINACKKVLLQVNDDVYQKIADELHNYQLQLLILERKDRNNKSISIFKIYPEYVKKIFVKKPTLVLQNELYQNLFDKDGKYKGLMEIINSGKLSTFCHKTPLFLYYFWLLELLDMDYDKISNREDYDLIYKSITNHFREDYTKYLKNNINNSFSSKEYKRIMDLIDGRN